MNSYRWLLLSLPALCWTCASAGSTDAARPAASGVHGTAFQIPGFSLERPEHWIFITPDDSVTPQTVLVMQRAGRGASLAPRVEVEQRPLSADAQRRDPMHILTALVVEIVQTFDAFEADGAPEDVKVGGQPAGLVRMRVHEMLPTGEDVDQRARFYGVVTGQDIWVIRCFGPADGSADADFDAIVAGIWFPDE